MSIRIEIKNFFIGPADNWKKKLAWIIIGFIITSFLTIGKDYIYEKFVPKPKVDINLVTLQPVNITNNVEEFQNFTLMYAGGNGHSQLLIVKNRDALGNVITTFLEPKDCKSCTFYTLNLRNNGDSDANSIILDLTTSEGLQIIKENQKLIEKNCGGSFESKGCHFKIENLLVNEEIFIALESTYSTTFKINCKVNNKEEFCNIKYADILVQIVPEKSIFAMDNKIVKIPDVKNKNETSLFYFDQNIWDWVQIEAHTEYDLGQPT
jgi:hypothetical protein